MNPNTATVTDPVPPPPQPPQPHRSSFSCERHPDEQFTGFCPSCLCERLTTLDHNNVINPSSSTASSRRNSTSAAAAAAAAGLKSLFSSKPSSSSNNGKALPPKPSRPSTSTATASLFPELRRTQSFSASGGRGINFSGAFEPQRKSCDVRVRNTLSSLFTLDNEYRTTAGASTSASAAAADRPSSSSQSHYPCNEAFVNRPVFEYKEVEGDVEEEVEGIEEDYKEIERVDNNVVDEITEVQQQLPRVSCSEIVEEEIGNESNFPTITKPMKDHIDLESQGKRTTGGMKEKSGSFWSAASVFSKKWNDWRRKQKLKKQNNGENSATLPVEKPLSRQYRETQSEIADYGFGRRSCDTDPRFSLDAGRISFDDARYSFDEPRASWDGHLIGKSFLRMHPLVEDAPVVNVPQSDAQIPVEDPQMIMNCMGEDGGVPGGSAQTRDYYADSSSRRRKSFDRSSSIRKTAAAVVAEIDELKAISNSNPNAKVSPTTVDSLHARKVLTSERVLRDSNSNSLRDDTSEIVGLSRSRDNVIGDREQKGTKKSRRWSWNLWGFIHKRNGASKDEDDERYSRTNGVGRSLSESWQERGGVNRNVFRSNSSVSWRNSSNLGGSLGNVRKSSVEIGHGKKKDEFVLERNRSARYSPKNDNGLLRFYLTPMRSSRRGAPAKNRLSGSHSIARSVLRLY